MPAQSRSAVKSRLAAAPPTRLMPQKRDSDRLLERLRTLVGANTGGSLDRLGDRCANLTADTRGSITRFPHDASRRRLVQLANDAYREWREHCSQLTHAYGCWADADSSKSEQAWEAYEDALALEEIAAARYAARAALVESVGPGDVDTMTYR
jgi:hypothetical protein